MWYILNAVRYILSLTCCSSFLLSWWCSSSSFWLEDGHGGGEEQLMTSHDVTSQGFRRTSALSTAASVILLNNAKHGLMTLCVGLHLYILLLFIDACICMSLRACECVCMLFLPIWSCLLESLTGEWWGHISHVPTGQPETQLSSPPVLAFSTVPLSAGSLLVNGK